MNQPNEQQIEDLLFNRLSKAEADQLRAKAASDEKFATILAQRQLELDAMAIAEEDAIRASMSSWSVGGGKEKLSTTTPLKVAHRRKPFTRILSIAASLLLLVFAGLTFFASSNYSNEVLAERYAQSRVAGARGANDAEQLAPVKALMAEGKYQEATTSLSGINGNAAAMLRGEAFYKLSQYDLSIQAYDKVVASDSQLADEAAFQRALVLLAAGQTFAATSAFEQVASNPTNAFAQNATKALNDLNGFWRNLAWW
jgi:tetratricopeptide (TPR) repeat protein